MANEPTQRMYTAEELESAVHKATKAENRIATCEANIEHQTEEIAQLRTEMTDGFKSIRAAMVGRNNGLWKRPTTYAASGGLMGAGGILYWLIEFVRGIEHGTHIVE